MRKNLFTEKHPAEPGQLTARWTPLKPHPEQLRLINSTARFKVVPAGRRSGKTFGGGGKSCRRLMPADQPRLA
jgi:hypothetical protein